MEGEPKDEWEEIKWKLKEVLRTVSVGAPEASFLSSAHAELSANRAADSLQQQRSDRTLMFGRNTYEGCFAPSLFRAVSDNFYRRLQDTHHLHSLC